MPPSSSSGSCPLKGNPVPLAGCDLEWDLEAPREPLGHIFLLLGEIHWREKSVLCILWRCKLRNCWNHLATSLRIKPTTVERWSELWILSLATHLTNLTTLLTPGPFYMWTNFYSVVFCLVWFEISVTNNCKKHSFFFFFLSSHQIKLRRTRPREHTSLHTLLLNPQEDHSAAQIPNDLLKL